VPDRDLLGGLPEVELADLARPIDRPLKRPGRIKQRPHLAQIVIDDRVAAIEPQRLDQLPDPLPVSFASALSSRWISSLNGSSFDPAAGREYFGALEDRNADRIVLRSRPVRRAISLIDTPSTKCIRPISAHCSTSTTDLLLTRPASQAQPQPGHHAPPRQGGENSTGAQG
jgi:hypothetical protein